ncbi:MAG: PIN domain-containing protein [Deltaproteobacteria bacterium]|nr:PIN domain-containing protein [Deltaproteobacteria bacterium]
MRVLVDTSVWSLALRRSRPTADLIVRELTELVQDGRVAIMGAIRQEVLSGVKEVSQFQTLRDRLRAFPDIGMETADFEQAAHFFNRCRARGVQGSNTDFLICAAASRRDLAIFTTDGDFSRFQRVVPFKLHAPRA